MWGYSAAQEAGGGDRAREEVQGNSSMAAVAAELQFSYSNCSAGGFSSISRGLRSSRVKASRRVSSSSGKLVPLTQTQPEWREWKARERDMDGVRGGERGFSVGKVGTAGRRSVAVHAATGRLDAPKPTFVPLEGITGEAHFDQVLSEAQERNQAVVIDWCSSLSLFLSLFSVSLCDDFW